MEKGGRKSKSKKNMVATGSIWESRMIIDQVKGGIKVFNGESNTEESQNSPITNPNTNNPKRKTWKSESTHSSIADSIAENSERRSSSIHRRMRSDGSGPSIKVRSEKSTVDTNESGKPKSERRRKPIEVEKGSETSFCLNLIEENMKNLHEKEEKKQVIFAENIEKTLHSSMLNRERLHSEDDSNVCHNKAMHTSVCHNNLMHLADLVMWRDPSRSALVFVVGTLFTLLSPSTNELNISFFVVLCYVGILYIAAMYLYKTITCSEMDVKSWGESYMVSEEEAIRLLKLVLPYINSFIFNIGCLFSGEPITTIKMVVLLFFLARSHCSISPFRMLKFGFFCAFTLPKIYSLYAKHLTNFAGLRIRHFRDVWDSFSENKAVAGLVFLFIWNISSITALLMTAIVVVGWCSYRQSEEEEEEEECWHETGVHVSSE